MELKDYLGIIKRRFVTFVLAIALVCIANGVYATYYLRPSYVATAQIKILRKSYDYVTPRSPLGPGEVAEIIHWFQIKINIMNDRIVNHAARKLWKQDEPEFAPFKDTQTYRRHFEGAKNDFNSFCKEKGKIGYQPRVTESVEHFIQTRFEKLIRNNIDIEELKDPTTQLPSRLVNLKAELGEQKAAIHLVNALATSAEEYHSEKPQDQLNEAITKIAKKIGESEERLKMAEAKIAEERRKAIEAYEGKKLHHESDYFEEDYIARIGELRRMKSGYRKKVKGFEEQIHVYKQMITQISYKANRRADARAVAYEKGWKSTPRLDKYRSRIEALQGQKLELESGTSNYQPTHPKIREINDQISLVDDLYAEMLLKEVENFRGVMHQELQDRYMDTDLLSVRQEVYESAKDEISEELGILKNFNKFYTEYEETSTSLIKEILQRKQQQQELEERRSKVTGLLVVSDVASGSSVAVKNPLPLTTKGWGLCVLLALLVSIFIVYFLEYIDTRITTEYDVRRHLNIPVIGVVPHVSRGNVLLTEALPTSPMSEIFNTTATLIRSIIGEKAYKNVVVCSALPREGKTSVSLNLSIAIARKGLNVLLVDTDLRLPQIHNFLGLPNNVGLSTILEQKLEEKQIVNDILEIEETVRYNLRDYLLQTSVPQLPNLRVLPSGPLTQNPIHLIESGSMRGLVERLKREADIIIYDTPPVMKAADALSLATICDACIFVIGSGQIEQNEASWAKHLFNNVEADMIGVVLNKTRHKTRAEYYKYYPYYRRGRRKTVKRQE